MGAIAGVVHFDGSQPASREQAAAMLRPLRQRSPDGQTAVSLGSASFAKGLAITTHEATLDRQPWTDATARYLVVADTRLDNRPELSVALGYAKESHDKLGDGELLLAAWQRWGRDFPDRLRGDFAFAIWDSQTGELFCGRDPMGVKPFYYHLAHGNRLVFASSAAAVLAAGGIPADLNEVRIADAIVQETEGADQTSTFYRAVHRLPPAHTMLVRADRCTIERYWQPLGGHPPQLPTNDAAWLDAIRDAVDKAVARRLRSNAMVGSMLSGGLDSSTIVALAARRCRDEGLGRLPTYSAFDSGNPDCRESAAIRTLAASLEIDSRTSDAGELPQHAAELRQWLQSIEEPFDAHMGLVAAVYRLAAQCGTHALMDGVPADNLFAVGQFAGRQLRRGQVATAWRAAVEHRRGDGIAHSRLAALRMLLGYLAPDGIRRARALHREEDDYDELLRGSLIDRRFAARCGFRGRYRQYRQSLADSHAWSDDGQALSSLGAAYISAGIERYHRVAGYFGIEPRPVYCDRDLIELFAWLPIRLRVRDGHWKWAMRKAMADLLPASVLWRRDRSHLGPLFSRSLFPETMDSALLETLSPYLDVSALGNALAACRRRGQGALPPELHMPCALAVFLHRHATNPGGRLPPKQALG